MRQRGSRRSKGEIKRIGELLVERGFVTEADIAAALERQRSTGRRLGETLFEMGAISSSDLARTLAERQEIRFVDLNETEPEPNAVLSIPPELSKTYSALGVVLAGQRLVVAMMNPTDFFAIDDLRAVTGLDIEPAMADPAKLAELLSIDDGGASDIAPELAGGTDSSSDAESAAAPADGASRSDPQTRVTRSDGQLLARELGRLEMTTQALDGEAANLWSSEMKRAFADLHLLAFRNIAAFLSDSSLTRGATAFASTWPPEDSVPRNAVDRLAAQATWLDRRLAGPASDRPDRDAMPEGRLDEMTRDLHSVLDSFAAALPADRRDWFPHLSPSRAAPDAPKAAVSAPRESNEVGLGAFAELRSSR